METNSYNLVPEAILEALYARGVRLECEERNSNIYKQRYHQKQPFLAMREGKEAWCLDEKSW